VPPAKSRPAEIQTVFQQRPVPSDPKQVELSGKLPPEVASEIGSIEAMHRDIISGKPIDQWRFEAVRGRYQSLLKRFGDDSTVEAAIRVRLASLTRYEQVGQLSRTIQDTLAQSHRRDRSVTDVKRRLAGVGTARPQRFSAAGFMKPSSHMIDGRRLYTLVGRDGSTVALLDIPPGLDLDPLVAHRVGVRGPAHYDESLHARLITVRAIESIDLKR
jgi:hypothetical protein